MLKILLAILGCIIVFKSSAATVTVYNNNQKVQENVVVWLAPEQASGVNINKSLFTMTQKNRQFTPHILASELQLSQTHQHRPGTGPCHDE